MRILFVGDIVGQCGVDLLVEVLPGLRERHAIDVVVANGENMNLSGPRPQTGFGMRPSQIESLFAAGVDIITSGNHAWDGEEHEQALAYPNVVRPVNVPDSWAGHGTAQVTVGDEVLTVVNIADDSAISEAGEPYAAFTSLALAPGPVLVDYHGDIVSRKMTFAFAVDGDVTAVVGTHTHEPSLLAHHLPHGTGFVAEAGMTGPLGGILGSDPHYAVGIMRGHADQDLPAAGLATGPVMLGAVLISVDGTRTSDIVRIGRSGEATPMAFA